MMIPAYHCELDGELDFVTLCSDGIFDVLKEQLVLMYERKAQRNAEKAEDAFPKQRQDQGCRQCCRIVLLFAVSRPSSRKILSQVSHWSCWNPTAPVKLLQQNSASPAERPLYRSNTCVAAAARIRARAAGSFTACAYRLDSVVRWHVKKSAINSQEQYSLASKAQAT